MEDVTEFKKWFYQLLVDAEKKLCLSHATLADILIKEGLNYYLKSKCEMSSGENSQQRRL